MQRNTKSRQQYQYKKIHDVLFNKHEDKVLHKGFRYVDGTMKKL